MAWKNYWRHYSGPDYKFIAFAVVILALAVVVAYSGYKPQVQPLVTTTTTATTTEPPKPVTGNLVIAIKDGGIKLQGLGTATSLLISVNSIDISEGIVNDTNSTWTNIFSGSKSVDIINYQNTSAIILQKELTPSSYHKIRFNLNDSEIKIYYYALGLYNKTYPLLSPTDVIVPADFSITAGKKTVLTFDFLISQSIVKEPDKNGVFAYKLKPQIETSQLTLNSDEPVPNSETV